MRGEGGHWQDHRGKEFFPGVPDKIMSRVVPSMEVDDDALPWKQAKERNGGKTGERSDPPVGGCQRES